MKIVYHKRFEKRFKKLDASLKEKVVQTIKLFGENPRDPSLHNHPLKGKLKDTRSISVTGDMRIIFEEIDDYVLVIMLDVGTHNQVYGKN